jgi:carbon monoxide dehydrogenase subunit G
MTCFSATNHSHAVVAADRKQVWAALTDPVLLPELTPLLRRIDVDGDTWRWHLTRLTVLGIGIAPVFTEKMSFDEPRRIDYRHQPPGRAERAGADGSYVLEEHPRGTHLEIELTMHVDLPLSRLASPAVTRVMGSMMQRTGERFADNLLRHLGTTAVG